MGTGKDWVPLTIVYHHPPTAACMSLIKGMLQPDPCKRLKLTAVMQHPWVTNKGTWPLYPFIPPKTNEALEKQVGLFSFFMPSAIIILLCIEFLYSQLHTF